MEKKHIIFLSLGFLFVLGAVMVMARLPTNRGDPDTWGSVLNTCLDTVLDSTTCDFDAGTIVSADIGLNVIDDVDVVLDGLDETSLDDTLDLTAAAEDFNVVTDAANNLLVTGVQSTDVTLAANRVAISGAGMVYEGATAGADAFETTLAVTDPTADNTYTFGATGEFTSTGDLGWTLIAGDGAATCSARCGTLASSAGCVFALNDADDGGAGTDRIWASCALVAAAAGDQCFCAGA